MSVREREREREREKERERAIRKKDLIEVPVWKTICVKEHFCQSKQT